MEKQAKREIVITGTTVARAVQVLTGLFLIWELVQTMLDQQALDANIVALLVGSLACLETSLQGETRRVSDGKTGI